MSVILLSEALRILHSGAVCSLTYVSADRKRGTGGKLIHVPTCVIYSEDAENTAMLRVPTHHPETPAMVGVPTHHPTAKPNHYLHKTRNIYIPSTREIKKLHIKLITRFNGKKVLL